VSTAKIAITIEEETLGNLDRLDSFKVFPNRSQAIEKASKEKPSRVDRIGCLHLRGVRQPTTKGRVPACAATFLLCASEEIVGRDRSDTHSLTGTSRKAKISPRELDLAGEGLNEILGGQSFSGTPGSRAEIADDDFFSVCL
jgi:hypothetical protein